MDRSGLLRQLGRNWEGSRSAGDPSLSNLTATQQEENSYETNP
jgi:hypothetical protein